MKKISLIFLIFLFEISSCDNPSSDLNLYNKKADELLSQFLNSEENCDCMFKTFNSLTEIYKNEQPNYNINPGLIKRLEYVNESDLKYMESLSDSYQLNLSLINREIKIIDSNEIPRQFESIETHTSKEYTKKCPNSHCILSKPLFNKDFKIAVMHSGNAFSCLGFPPLVFKYVNGHWINEGFL